MKKLFLLIVLMIISLSCNSPKIGKVSPAFYYWKTSSPFMDYQNNQTLKNCKTEKLYVKLFEITHDALEGNIPISKNQLKFTTPRDFSVIPCIYIDNKVFKKNNKEELNTLADNINYLINKKITDKFTTSMLVNEIQIDCDWTKTTKENYFYFLKKIKEISKKEISCTLRLYPYKYPEIMGIPPVDKAMLMCYNLINPLTNKDKSAILDTNELKKYVTSKEKYPKHLDIAFPLYSWMQVYQNNQFTKVIYSDFDKIKKVLKPIKPFWFEVTEDLPTKNMYLRIGDKIKYDETTLETVTKAIEIIKENIYLDKEITVSFFHLDNQQFKNIPDEEISNLYSLFTK